MRNNEKEPLFLDQKGYDQLLQEIELLKGSLHVNSMEKSEAYAGAAGDGWHDNFAFEETNRQEELIISQLNRCYENLSRVIIVEKESDDNIVDLDNIVDVKMIFSEDDIEDLTFRLIGGQSALVLSDGLQGVSINSPLGKAVYKKQVGEMSSYEVDGQRIDVEILGKNNSLQEGFSKSCVQLYD